MIQQMHWQLRSPMLLLINMLNILIRLATFILFIIWFFYWTIGEYQADKEKPRMQKSRSLIEWASGLFGRVCLGTLFVMQIFGWQFFSFQVNTYIKLIGFGIFLVGFVICILARYKLATNWTNALNYQVKENHELVTTGIYGVVRHPIYLGGSLLVLGIELLVGSYLFLAFFVMFFMAYIQGRKEEKILLDHFGKEYREYKQHTKMLIPLLI